jgi:hypothetical protein
MNSGAMSRFPRLEAMLLRPLEVNDREQRTHLAVKELQDYFKDHWFSNEWSCHWQHHLIRGEESLDLNYSTNNNIESTWRLVSECIAPHGCNEVLLVTEHHSINTPFL